MSATCSWLGASSAARGACACLGALLVPPREHCTPRAVLSTAALCELGHTALGRGLLHALRRSASAAQASVAADCAAVSLRHRRPFRGASHPLFPPLLHPLSTPLSTPFPRRFAPQARELWLVGGERSLLGKTVALEEFAGCSATGPPHPIVSHSPTDDHKKYGLSYLDMDTRAKFHCEGLCSVGVRMLAWSDENDLLGSAQVHPLRLFRKCQTAQSRQRAPRRRRGRTWALPRGGFSSDHAKHAHADRAEALAAELCTRVHVEVAQAVLLMIIRGGVRDDRVRWPGGGASSVLLERDCLAQE